MENEIELMTTSSNSDDIEQQGQSVSAMTGASPLDMPSEQFASGLQRRGDNRNNLMTWIRANLKEGSDFYILNLGGRKSKPSMSKAGAEKVCGMLGMTATFPNLCQYEKMTLEGKEIKQILLRCEIMSASGQLVGMGVGARTVAQDKGDLNKALKMAEKSSMIDAVLRAGGLSEIFTQDIEDTPNESTQRATYSKPVQPTTRPAATSQAVAGKKQATEKTRQWAIAELKQEFSEMDIKDYLKVHNLSLWDLKDVPTSKQELAELKTAIGKLAGDDEIPMDFADDDKDEPFWDAVITLPRAGTKKKEYLQDPDTIRSLYDATKDGDEDAKKRLWGVANEWEPKPYDYNGKTYQPSEGDYESRKALNDFLAWHKQNEEN